MGVQRSPAKTPGCISFSHMLPQASGARVKTADIVGGEFQRRDDLGRDMGSAQAKSSGGVALCAKPCGAPSKR